MSISVSLPYKNEGTTARTRQRPWCVTVRTTEGYGDNKKDSAAIFRFETESEAEDFVREPHHSVYEKSLTNEAA